MVINKWLIVALLCALFLAVLFLVAPELQIRQLLIILALEGIGVLMGMVILKGK